MHKTIYSLPALCELLEAAKRQYLEFLSTNATSPHSATGLRVPPIPGAPTVGDVLRASAPLPGELGGVSVRIGRPPARQAQMPLVAIQQQTYCDTVSPLATTCLVTLVTVQVPYEISLDANLLDHRFEPPAFIQVFLGGKPGPLYFVRVSATKVHFVRWCDTPTGNSCAPFFFNPAFVTNHQGQPVRATGSGGVTAPVPIVPDFVGLVPRRDRSLALAATKARCRETIQYYPSYRY